MNFRGPLQREKRLNGRFLSAHNLRKFIKAGFIFRRYRCSIPVYYDISGESAQRYCFLLNAPHLFNDSFIFQVFEGNCDNITPVANVLKYPTTARYIRLYPIKFVGLGCLRVELYGC